MKKISYCILIAVPLMMSCGEPSAENKAQEERRDSTEYYHTSYPATEGKNSELPDSAAQATSDSSGSNERDSARR